MYKYGFSYGTHTIPRVLYVLKIAEITAKGILNGNIHFSNSNLDSHCFLKGSIMK